jgi:hypothetical protein
MTDNGKWAKIETALLGILHVQAMHHMLLSGVLEFINQEMPDFKQRTIACIR